VVRIVRKTENRQKGNHENAPDHPRRVRKAQKEMDYLWREERPEVTKKVTWAASLGDRSENADYQYNKKRLREIDRRVRYLTKCLRT
jgi:transcription elongation GreA/GreB family factor